MPSIRMVATKPLRYNTRRLQAGDDFECTWKQARRFEAAGDAIQDEPGRIPQPKIHKVKQPVQTVNPLQALRQEYKNLRGVKPDPSWDVARLSAEIKKG